jgi:hypothetical protein
MAKGGSQRKFRGAVAAATQPVVRGSLAANRCLDGAWLNLNRHAAMSTQLFGRVAKHRRLAACAPRSSGAERSVGFHQPNEMLIDPDSSSNSAS